MLTVVCFFSNLEFQGEEEKEAKKKRSVWKENFTVLEPRQWRMSSCLYFFSKKTPTFWWQMKEIFTRSKRKLVKRNRNCRAGGGVLQGADIHKRNLNGEMWTHRGREKKKPTIKCVLLEMEHQPMMLSFFLASATTMYLTIKSVENVNVKKTRQRAE